MPGLLEDTDPYASLIDKFAMQRKLLQNVQDYAQQVQQMPMQQQQQAQQTQAATPAMAAGLSNFLGNGESENEKRRNRLMPLAMGLMGLSSGLLTNPWYGGGLGMGLQNAQQGLLGAYQMQRQQQAAKQQQLKNLIDLQRAAAEARGPQPMTIGGKQGVYEPRHGFKYAPQEKPTSEPLEKVDTPQGPMYIPRSQAAGMVPYERPKENFELYVNPQDQSKFAWGQKGGPAPYPGYVPKEIATGAGLSTIDEKDLEFQARRAIATGHDPSMGFAAPIRARYWAAYRRVAEKADLSPEEASGLGAEFASNKTALAQLTSLKAKVLSFSNTAAENIKLALEESRKVDRSGVPLFNKWVQKGKRSITGDPELSAFDASIRIAINEVAKVTSSATAAGVLSDSARKEIEDVMNAAQTPQQFARVTDILKADMENRRAGIAKEEKILRGNLSKSIDKIVPSETGQDRGGEGNSRPGQVTAEDRQQYDAKLSQVQAMPDGPQKQQLLQQLSKFAKKWGIQ